ncbi:MAG: class I SAM-dependent methyltransferase [Rhodobacteraceae bacterium]|nr:class I SAM-dependent methyltransferase [Paracoccaceae bacterium]
MFNRRSFVSVSSFLAGIGLLPASKSAQAKSGKLPVDIAPRGAKGRTERHPTLDLESRQDFMAGVTLFANGELGIASRNRVLDILAAKKLNPQKEMPIDEARALFDGDPVIGMRDRMWHSAHNYEHDILDEYFHANADKYLAELEAADKSGPGTLELNPDMKVPDYTRHEIHQQPGGYVGNPFAGHIYHYATNMFYRGGNDQDQRHISYAAACPTPADGSVKRILDIGTGIGQFAVALKERFPDADVHGIDVGAPMLRYGHMRAIDLDVEVHFAQRLAEETGFPDNHFDMVVSYIMFHEVPAEATRKIYAEANRILRPGGVFYPMDFNHASPRNALRQYGEWKDHRWNNERWRLEYASLDIVEGMRSAGFSVDDQSDKKGTFARVIGTKAA